MNKLIREFFFLRKGERRALYFVLTLMLLSAVFRTYVATRPLTAFEPDTVFVAHMEEIRRQIDSSLKQEQIAELSAAARRGTGKWQQGQPGMDATERTPLTPVPFDPNTVSHDTLLAMNLSAYVSNNIIRYRQAGGTFREPGDLQKIYGLTKKDYDALYPYIILTPGDDPATVQEDRFDSSGTQTTWKESPEPLKDTLYPLELNRADSADLVTLPGIGPWFAGRIIRYRELLGGYVHPEQLLEVYGMDSARFNGFVSRVTADTALIHRIDLNNSSFQDLLSHPYISREDTYAIFRYLDFVDSIPQSKNILIDQIIDRERFMRMAPYLSAKSSQE